MMSLNIIYGSWEQTKILWICGTVKLLFIYFLDWDCFLSVFMISLYNFIFEIWWRLRSWKFSTNKRQAEDMTDLSQEGCIGLPQLQGQIYVRYHPIDPWLKTSAHVVFVFVQPMSKVWLLHFKWFCPCAISSKLPLEPQCLKCLQFGSLKDYLLWSREAGSGWRKGALFQRY